MGYFDKALKWTITVGFVLLGVWTGLLVLRIAIEVAGLMLGSSIGTLILALFLWRWYKRHKDSLLF